MTAQQLMELASASRNLFAYSEMLLDSFDQDTYPPEFNSMVEWREHLSNMCGHYRMVVGTAYNNVNGWREI